MAATSAPMVNFPGMVELREIITADAPSGSWDVAWQKKLTPWDAGDVQPPLKEVIESGLVDFPRQGRALVPGCGSGYDVLYISTALGLECLGLDISPTAVEAANALAAKAGVSDKVAFTVQDFFAMQVPDSEKFDIIYDYTFFVAIPPSRRLEWGKQMNALIKPGGYLITLVFPIDPPTDIGPPFFVRPEHYLEPLGDNWEKVLDKVPETSIEFHVGKERIVVWRKT